MAFRLTLTVRDEPPVRMLFDQHRVTVGRAPSNDVVVHDPKVSKAHAVIEQMSTGHHQLHDRDSKNATFVEDEQVGPQAPVVLSPGASVHIGDSVFSYMPLVPVTAAPRNTETPSHPDAEDASATEDLPDDPDALFDMLERSLVRLASHLAGDSRVDDLDASQSRYDEIGARMAALPDAATHALVALVDLLKDEVREPIPPPDDVSTSPDAWGALPVTVRDILALPTALWDHLDEAPPAAARPLLDEPTTAEVAAALGMQANDESAALDRLCTALQHVVAHHRAMLESYQSSIKTGGKALLRHISPHESVPDPSKTGVFTRVFGGGDTGVSWERLERRWRKLYHSDWNDIEAKLFRPALLEAYQEHMHTLAPVRQMPEVMEQADSHLSASGELTS